MKWIFVWIWSWCVENHHNYCYYIYIISLFIWKNNGRSRKYENSNLQKIIFFKKNLFVLSMWKLTLDYGNHTTLFHTSYTNHGEINIVIFWIQFTIWWRFIIYFTFFSKIFLCVNNHTKNSKSPSPKWSHQRWKYDVKEGFNFKVSSFKYLMH